MENESETVQRRNKETTFQGTKCNINNSSKYVKGGRYVIDRGLWFKKGINQREYHSRKSVLVFRMEEPGEDATILQSSFV